MDEETRRLLLTAAALAVNGHALRRDYGRVCAAVAVLTPVLLVLWYALQPLPAVASPFHPSTLCATAARSAIIAAVIGLPFALWRSSVRRGSPNRALTPSCTTDVAAAVARRAASFSLFLRLATGMLWGLGSLLGLGLFGAYLGSGGVPLADPSPDEEKRFVYADAPLTPLNVAVATNDEPMVIRLLARGADVNTGDGWLRTPLAVAAEAGNVEMMRLLIHRGAAINDSTRGSAALWNAAINGRPDAVRFLVERGADPNTTVGRSLLSEVREHSPDSEIPLLLVAAGAR